MYLVATRLLNAQERGNAEGVERYSKHLRTACQAVWDSPKDLMRNAPWEE